MKKDTKEIDPRLTKTVSVEEYEKHGIWNCIPPGIIPPLKKKKVIKKAAKMGA